VIDKKAKQRMNRSATANNRVMLNKGLKAFACGISLAAFGLCLADRGCAQDVSSAPAGFHRIDLLGNSDTFVSFPFTRPPAANGLVASVAENVVTLSGRPAWTPNQFVYTSSVQSNHYFMLICNGAKEGTYHPIAANGVDTLTLQLDGDTLMALSAGDRVAIIPYWTLGTVFPGGQGVHSSSPGDRPTEVLLPDLAGVGINRSAEKTFYFWNGAWRQVGSAAAIKNDEVLLPDAYVIVRHNIDVATTLTIRGAVTTTKWAVPLTVGSSLQDNFVGWMRPASQSLADSGLLGNGAFTASPGPGERTDELLVFGNGEAGYNKSAAATYYYWNGAWRLVGGGLTDRGGSLIFTPGTGVVIRKAAAAAPATWVNSTNKWQ
jgi:uncharacterized protein (TIGR02597 family)